MLSVVLQFLLMKYQFPFQKKKKKLYKRLAAVKLIAEHDV